MNITNYIVEFLKQGNAVEIKGIGTFSPKIEFTHFDEETKEYFPAIQTVEFSTVCKGNEQIISYIAKQEFIGVTTAEKLWDNYIVALNDKLNVDGKHEFPGMGKLVYSADNGYSFDAFEEINFSKSTRRLPVLKDIVTYDLNPERENPFDKFDSPVIPVEKEDEAIAEEQPQDEQMLDEIDDNMMAEDNSSEENENNHEIDNEISETENVEKCVGESEEKVIEEIPVGDAEKVENEEDKDEVLENKEVETNQENSEEVESEEVDVRQEDNEDIKEENNNDEADNELKDNKKDKKKKRDKKKKNKKERNTKERNKKLLIPLIILLILLLLGGAYYYFVVVKDTYIPFINEYKEVVENETTEELAETDATDEQVVADTTDVQTTSNDEATEQLELFKGENMFTFDYTLVPIDNKEEVIETTCKTIVSSMSNKIEAFLKKQHYTTAKAPIIERMNEYVIKRLKELFSDDFFHPARMMSYDNYITDYCADNLQRQRISRAKRTIVSEIQMNDMMLNFLNELIDAGVVKKDKIVPPAPKPKVVPTADIRLRSKQGFDIISGFFKSRDNAVSEAHRFSRRGADAYVISKGNLYYVSLGSAPSQTAAEALLRQLKTWNKENMVIKKW